MAHLSVSLLGPFRVTLDGEPVTSFESTKVRALLAYLAVEADRVHRREVLAGLLWPDWPDRAALGNLRYALYNLRQAVGDRTAEPPFLLITRHTLQFNTASDHWLDVATFEQGVESASRRISESANQRISESASQRGGDQQAAISNLHSPFSILQSAIRNLQSAVHLYRASFLEGFSVGDSPYFEEWVLFTRERLARQMSSALHALAAAHEARGEYEQAQACARRQLELEPWDEGAHRQLMRTLALGGRRGAALVQYETCRRLLAVELDVEPARETTALVESIRGGSLSRGAEEQRSRGEIFTPAPPPPSPPAPFVGRERELAKLDRFLDLALAGQGRVAFVIGEAGSGKTELVDAFTRRAMAAHRDLVVARGSCNAQSGIGDPYLPFREILHMLTGDVERQRAGGAITGEHARRLWALLPDAVRALVEDGPDLVGRFVPGAAAGLRAEVLAPGGAAWRTRLGELVKRKFAEEGGEVALHQADLFEQLTRVLQSLARRHPLILVLDDLQWADAGSVSLLFHLGRRLAGSRILVVGAYRPCEVALVRPDPKGFPKPLGPEERHPLAPVVHEFRRDFGDILVDLDRAGGRPFVEALLDSEPNRLDAPFRETLARHTGGNPLFTVELLRGLQERGDLVRDEAGRWVAGPALDWGRLPPRVEAVIAERIGRLPPEWQETLTAASVQGEVFAAEVVARVQGLDEEEVVRRLSGPLSKQRHLVRAHSLEQLGTGGLRLSTGRHGELVEPSGQRLSRYRFHHYLFQKYLYGRLDVVERARLHEAVGNELEALYGEGAAEVAVQLAYHFEAAGLADRAVGYLLQAGRQAFQLSANEEAIAHFTRGLALLKALPESPERTRRELGLQLALAAPLFTARGWGVPERVRACARAYELGREIGETTSLLPALCVLAGSSRAQGAFEKSLDLGEQLLGLARQAQDSAYIVAAHWTLGAGHYFRGEFVLAREYLERANANYDPQRHRFLRLVSITDVGVLCRGWMTCTLWALGYPEQALAWSQEALALAQALDHAHSLAHALAVAGSNFHLLRRDVQAARETTSALLHLATGKSVPFYEAVEMVHQGYEQVATVTSLGASAVGTVEGGWPEPASSRASRGIEGPITQMRRGLAALQAMSATRPRLLLLLAEAYGRTGQADQGLRVLDETLALIEQTTARCSEAELHRLKGELLLMQGAGGAEAAAEACFQRAIDLARQQQAKSWELRAAMSLCRLWQRQGKREEALPTAGRRAHQLLAGIYGWFTEGFDTPDLKDARALLEELSA
jgi:DNA-binding SARP family transcriptional activator/predicted ATPase